MHLGDTATDFGAKVLDNTVSAILQLREHLNFDNVERAIDILKNGAQSHRDSSGLGNSNIVAQDAHYRDSSASAFRRLPTATCTCRPHPPALLGKSERDRGGVEVGARAGTAARASRLALQQGATVIRDHVEQYAALPSARQWRSRPIKSRFASRSFR